MKVTHDYISSQYHQVYFVFSEKEINEIFDEVAEENNLVGRLSQKSKKKLLELTKEKIENEVVEEELIKSDIIPISFRKYRYLTPLVRNHNLLLIVQFCVLPTDLQLNFPSKIPNGIFNIPYESQMIKDFTQQILLVNNQYDYRDVKVANNKSYVKYDLFYTKDDFVINEIKDQVNSVEDYENPDEYSFVNCKVGDTVILDEDDGIVVKAKVKEIKNKVLRRLSNEIVENLNFLGCKTVTEFRQKIKDIFSFSTTVVLLLNYLADFILHNGDFEFDQTVIDHFAHEDLSEYEKKRELLKEYIIWIINYNYSDDNILYMDKIIEEYEFDKILFDNPHRVDRYQEFINRRIYEVRVLEYCLEQKILDIEL
ncbi:MAG: hypothetical protein PHV87_01655 [Bacilli bacterium]|nr:hypothetical protein [Bacilli bacterium]